MIIQLSGPFLKSTNFLFRRRIIVELDLMEVKWHPPVQADVSGACHKWQPLILHDKSQWSSQQSGNNNSTVWDNRRKCTCNIFGLALLSRLDLAHRKLCSMKMKTKSWKLQEFVLKDLHVGTCLLLLSGKVWRWCVSCSLIGITAHLRSGRQIWF